MPTGLRKRYRPSTGRSASPRSDRHDYLRLVIGTGSVVPAFATRTLSPMRHLPALVAVAVLASACGLGDGSEPGMVAGVTTTLDEVAVSIAVPVEARPGFVTAAGGDRALVSLSSSDLGCVADELLVVLSPTDVVALTATGPTPAQVPVVVEALQSCDLVIEVARLGLAGGFVGGSGAPGLDPTCVLKGVTEDDMAPVLEALFTGTGTAEIDRTVDVLLSETPVMSNLVLCGLEGIFDEAGGEVPSFCRGLLDRVAVIMTAVVKHGTAGDSDVVDPVLLAELFGLFEDVLVWLADHVPDHYQVDAAVVRDTSVKVSEVMAEALHGLDDSSDPQVVLSAVFGAVVRIDAELAVGAFELESTLARLESYVTSTCGDSVAGLFDLLSEAGTLSGV